MPTRRIPTPRRLPLLFALPLLAPLLAAVFFAAPASAHPHVFVDCTLTFVVDAKGLAGFREEWSFDEMFSATILDDVDANHDGKLSKPEVAALKTGYFDNLVNFGYFSHLFVNGAAVPVKKVSDFSASVAGGKVRYGFFVPCPVPVDASTTIALSVFDESYYSDLYVPTEAIHVQNSGRLHVVHDVGPARELAFYNGQVVPDAVTLTLSPQ